MSLFRPTTILAALVCSLSISQAAVTLVRSYHLGDLDAAAGNNVVATNSADYIGGVSVAVAGDPVYSTDVPSDYPLINTFSMNFTGTNYATSSGVTNLTDNFGISAWVKVRSVTGANRAIVYNGDSTNTGWGLYQIGNTFQGVFGGITSIGSASVQTNVWTHLALVRDQGLTTFYVNGTTCGTNTTAPNPADGFLALGVGAPGLASEFFDGLIDEVTVFTFDAGTFSTNDLGYVPPAARTLSTTINGNTVVISWPTNRSDFELQFTTNLQSGLWTSLSYMTNNGQFTVSETPGDAQRFYQLKKVAADLNARPSVPMIRVLAHNVTTGVDRTTFPEVYYDGNFGSNKITLVNTANEFTWDLPGASNPRTGTTEALNYYWTISYSIVPMYTDIGITGYRTRSLHIQQHALAASSAGTTVTVTVDVSSDLNPSGISHASFLAVVNNTVLNLTMYSICQTPGVEICPTCECTVPEAAPTNELK